MQGHASERVMRQALVHSLIDVQIADLLETSLDRLGELHGLDSIAARQLAVQLDLSPPVASEREQLSQFLFENVYRHPHLMQVRQRAATRLKRLVDHLVQSPQLLPERFVNRAQRVGVMTAVGQYIAGMTDRFCDEQYRQLIELGGTRAQDW
jgi:dGTPase